MKNAEFRGPYGHVADSVWRLDMLAWTIYLSFLGALTALLAAAGAASRAGHRALDGGVGTRIGLGGNAAQRQAELRQSPALHWIRHLGIEYHLAADGISLTLVLLTGLAATAGILFSWNIGPRTGEFFAFYLTLIAGVYGVFLSVDVLLFFVFYELAIVPKYFLIAIWGSPTNSRVCRDEAGPLFLRRKRWSSPASSRLGGRQAQTMDLAAAPAQIPSRATSRCGLAFVFVGFAVLAGLLPFHTWAPTGHVAAPTGASMLLAGVVMKLGAYGCLARGHADFPRGLVVGISVLGGLARPSPCSRSSASSTRDRSRSCRTTASSSSDTRA